MDIIFKLVILLVSWIPLIICGAIAAYLDTKDYNNRAVYFTLGGFGIMGMMTLQMIGWLG